LITEQAVFGWPTFDNRTGLIWMANFRGRVYTLGQQE